MAYNVKTYFSAGLDQVWMGALNSSGYFIGSTASEPTAGDTTGSSLIRLEGAKNFPFTTSEPERVNSTGDDGPIGQFQFKPIELPSGQPTFAIANHTAAALAMGTKIHDVSGWSMLGFNPSDVSFQDVMFLLVSQAKSRDSGSVGSAHYACRLLLKNSIYYQGPTNTSERTAAEYQFSVTSNYADQYPWGVAFSDTNNGATEFAAMDFVSPFKPFLVAWKGDGVETGFDLPYEAAEDAANSFIVTVAGTAQTWVADTPSTGEFDVDVDKLGITFGAAPADGALIVCMYNRAA